VFEDASADLLDEVDRHARNATGADLPFLYGPVPRSVVVLHFFWDAWIHERDVLLPLRRPHESSAVESRAAAAYGLMIGSVPIGLAGTSLDETIVLAGDGGGTFRPEVRESRQNGRRGFGASLDAIVPWEGLVKVSKWHDIAAR
jgi:hypothetical protein